RYLQGTRIEQVDAPDVTPAGLLRIGFDAAALSRYLPAGMGPQGVMNFSMYDGVHSPTRWRTRADAPAMAAYLMGSRPVAASAPAAPAAPGSALPAAGRGTYLQLCSASHGVGGGGIRFGFVGPAMGSTARALPMWRRRCAPTPACAGPRRATCSSSSPAACQNDPCPAASASRPCRPSVPCWTTARSPISRPGCAAPGAVRT